MISQGWDPAKVDKGLKSQLEELVAAGYNTVTVWNGPEVRTSFSAYYACTPDKQFRHRLRVDREV